MVRRIRFIRYHDDATLQYNIRPTEDLSIANIVFLEDGPAQDQPNRTLNKLLNPCRSRLVSSDETGRNFGPGSLPMLPVRPRPSMRYTHIASTIHYLARS
jgi:hypothetical protein